MIPLSLLLCLFQSLFAGPSRTTNPTNLQSFLDTISNTTDAQSNDIQVTRIPEGTYVGDNVKIIGRYLELSGEPSNQRSSPGTRIIPQSGSEINPNEERFPVHTGTNCIFSLTNSTLSLKSLHFSLAANSEEARKQRNEAHTTRLAIVSDSMLTISESRIELSSGSSAILILPSTFEGSTTESSVVVKKCSISSESGQLRGLVETAAFPDCGTSRSILIVGCSFSSQGVLGTDGIGLSLTHKARKRNDEMGRISSSLIGCSFVNMSSIGSSHLPQLSHLSQKMLGCVVSLTSSHLSGSTIRDVNNGGSVLCSNSSFSSLLSSPNTDSDPSPSITLPNPSQYPEQFQDGIAYFFDQNSGTDSTFANFSHCHFTGDKYVTNARPLTFKAYPGTITITSCSFTDLTVVSTDANDRLGGAAFIDQRSAPDCQPVTVEKTNFTNIKASISGSGMYVVAMQSTSIEDCRFEECGPGSEGTTETGGLYVSTVTAQPAIRAKPAILAYLSAHNPNFSGPIIS
ncbi:hypothetical protein BLNAU_19507 [Blattamonas nauphoetae]|uniref:Right handed beta helix domain-containing protein n=1 Tax=Blattamonas nauphoetae TaxID=2049346 RepID=A0ABQ9X5F4_9EUKA|nr:hypothetical protein BLNAU_19507 [Blattamonas nauphoetae]